MTIVVGEVRALADRLRLLQSSGAHLLVGIEGHSTAGKSTLAADLGRKLSGGVFSTDCYAVAEREVDTYVEKLRIGDLDRDLATTTERDCFVFVEGICLRQTLRAMHREGATLFVYCMRITQAGLWADHPENYIVDGEPAPCLSWVDRQSVVYHMAERPDEKADIVFQRRGGT